MYVPYSMSRDAVLAPLSSLCLKPVSIDPWTTMRTVSTNNADLTTFFYFNFLMLMNVMLPLHFLKQMNDASFKCSFILLLFFILCSTILCSKA